MKESGLPQKTWEWHELTAQSFSLSPTKSKSSFQSFTSTRVVTAFPALGWLKDAAQRLVPQPGCQRQGELGPKHRCPLRQPEPFHPCGPCRRLAAVAAFFPGHTLTHSFMPVCLFLHPLPASEVSFLPPPLPPPPHTRFFFHLKVIAIPGAFILDDVVVVRWGTCSSQSAVDLNAGESQQWA